MIKTVAQLLELLVSEETPALDAVQIAHGPTIGEMYEGLSGEILAKAIPPGLNLRVVTGFVADGVHTSGQIDRMVVRGSGASIPKTNSFVWPIQDVIAVVEVKKTLTAATLAESIEQLETVRKLEAAWLLRGEHSDDSEPRLAVRAFSQMTGRSVPHPKHLKDSPIEDRRLIHSLLVENYACLRIVFGVHGHKTESGLRKAFHELLKAGSAAGDLPPEDLPQLIVSGSFSLAKTNGQPYVGRLVDGEWPVIFSTPVSPILMLLEVLWTRLDQLFGLDDPWGEDLDIEVARNVLFARPTEEGWEYRSIPATEAELKGLSPVERWAPSRLQEPDHVVLTELCSGLRVFLSDPDLSTWLEGEGSSVELLRVRLLATGLVAIDGDELVLTTENCRIAVLPNGHWVAGEDNTGRLSRWLASRGWAPGEA